MKKSVEYLIYAICGALMALPYPVGSLWFVAWIAFIPVIVLEYKRERNTKHPLLTAYRHGMAFFYPYGIVTLYWFAELYPLDFAGLTKGAALCVVILGIFGLSLLQAIFWSFMFVVNDLLIRKCRLVSSKALSIFVPAFLWVVFEWMQAQTWAGVPWGKLALGQSSLRALIQSSSILGPYFVSFVIILFASLCASAIMTIREHNVRSGVLSLAMALLLFASNLTFGLIRINAVESSDEGRTITAAAIQGNISSVDKWSGDSFSKTLEAYEEETRKAAEEGAELVVFPETVLPYTLLEFESLTDYVYDLALDNNVTILVGAFYRNDSGNLENSIFLVGPDGTISDTHYSKRHLVPFGEFVPMRDIVMTLVPPLNDIGMLDDDLTPGTSSSLFDSGSGRLGSLICFDSIYEVLARDSAYDGAELLCISTNDSWFNDSAAVYEHNSHSVLRAVETGKYVVRAANTGISSVISSTGKVIDMLPPLVRGHVTAQVRLSDTLTVYDRVGNVIVPVCAVMTVLSAVWLTVKNKRSNGHNN